MATDAETLAVIKQTVREMADETRRHSGASGMSKHEVKDLIEEVLDEAIPRMIGPAVNRAVADTFSTFGIDTSNKFEFTKDMIFLRDLRNLSGDSKKHIVLSVLGIMTAGVVTAVVVYLKTTGKAP